MNDEQKPAPGTKLCKWAVWIAAAGVVVTLVGILGAAALGPFRAMLSLTLGSLLLIIGAVLAAIGLVRSRGTGGNASFPLTVGALAVGAAAFINLLIMIGSGGGPPIHRRQAPMHLSNRRITSTLPIRRPGTITRVRATCGLCSIFSMTWMRNK